MAAALVTQRRLRGESVPLLAQEGEAACGFPQRYPSFSSVHARRTWILNDLFVSPGARRPSTTALLLQSAADLARRDGALLRELETDRANAAAQALSRRLGWIEYDGSLRFHLSLQL